MEQYRGKRAGFVFDVPTTDVILNGMHHIQRNIGMETPLTFHCLSHNKIFYWLNINELRIAKNVTANDLETSYILFLSQLCNIQRTLWLQVQR